MLTWVVNAGGLGIVVAWFFVVISFLVLRYQEPEMRRPYTVPMGKVVGIFGLCLTAGFIYLYLPSGPSALVWPYEWLIVLAWTMLGIGLFVLSEGPSDAEAETTKTLDALESLEGED
jgi:APA family basic amino acid/polyamine antiporter